tara:strand:- start:998 stop:1294 length:297 start_codon:yes stop_codon:yes gene_type:complete
MNYDEPDSREGYWKRHFDDERRNKIPCQRPEPLLRKTETVEQREILRLRNEIKMYKQMLCEECSKNEALLANLYKERERANKDKAKLNKIKKCFGEFL